MSEITSCQDSGCSLLSGEPKPKPAKSKTVTGLLALFLGGVGAQFFYLGKTVTGILCVLMCWSLIPAVAGVIHGICILCMSQEYFEKLYLNN